MVRGIFRDPQIHQGALADVRIEFAYMRKEAGAAEKLNRVQEKFRRMTREARVFHEMEGEMWVHEGQRRLARIRAHLTADVKFAGGLLGHLDKARHSSSKTIAVQQKEYRSDFQSFPKA